MNEIRIIAEECKGKKPIYSIIGMYFCCKKHEEQFIKDSVRFFKEAERREEIEGMLKLLKEMVV